MIVPNIERPWQPKVVKGMLDFVKSGTKRIILNAPIGSGKTKIALELIRAVYREKGLNSYDACLGREIVIEKYMDERGEELGWRI